MMKWLSAKLRHKGSVIRTPVVMQMEAAECGAASLAIILSYHGCYVPLEKLRVICDVSRDGSNIKNMLKAAGQFGLLGSVKTRVEPEALIEVRPPCVLFVDFGHFIVYEGYYKGKFYVNDPARGHRTLNFQEMDELFTGVMATFIATPFFDKAEKDSNWFNTWRNYLIASRNILGLIFLIGVLLIIPGVFLPTFTQIYVDRVLNDGLQTWLSGLIFFMVAATLLQMGLGWLQQYFLLRWQMKLSVGSSAKMLWHIFHTPIEFFLQRNAGELASRVQMNHDVAALFTGQLVAAATNFVAAAFYLVVLLQYNAWLTVCGLLTVLVNSFFIKFLARMRIEQSMRAQSAQMQVTGTMVGSLQIIESIKAGGAESDSFVRWAGCQARLLGVKLESSVLNQTYGGIPAFSSAINSSIVLALGALLVMQGTMTAGSFVAFQGLMLAFLAPVGQLMNVGPAFQEAEASLNRINDVLMYEKDRVFASEAQLDSGDREEVRLAGSVEARELAFGYSKMAPELLKGFSFCVEAGKMLAIVGVSGSGKSTVTKLLTGLYHPWQGEILFDGENRERISRWRLAEYVRMVDQEIVLFEGTVAENIAMFDPEIKLSEIMAAAREACIYDEIMSRRLGFQEVVKENGKNFSGGQRQRIEIARALVRSPAVVILDEATSALDPLMEKQVMDNIRRRGMTCIVVAHRLSAIRDADEIIALQGGKVVERGTHEQLIENHGYYENLIRAE